jgi:hypothetical protein
MKANAASTANSGIARRPHVRDEVFDDAFDEAADGLGGGALDEAAAADEDAADAVEFADGGGLVCSC